MRAALVLVAACSSTAPSSPAPVSDAGQDVTVAVVIQDAAPDVAVDAGQDAGPVLGSPCDNPGYGCGNSTLTCFQTHTLDNPDMYGHCTFNCCTTNCAAGTIDPEARTACQARGGRCIYPQIDGPGQPLPICVPN